MVKSELNQPSFVTYDKYLGKFSHATLATFMSDNPKKFMVGFNHIFESVNHSIGIKPKPIFSYYQSQKNANRIYLLTYWESPEHRKRYRSHEKNREIFDWLQEIAEEGKFVHTEEMNVLLYWESTLNTQSTETFYTFSRATIKDPTHFKSVYFKIMKKSEFETSGCNNIFIFQDHHRPNVIFIMSGWSTANAYGNWSKMYDESTNLNERREKLGIIYPPDNIDLVKQRTI